MKFLPRGGGGGAGFPAPRAVGEAEAKLVARRPGEGVGIGGSAGERGLELLEVARPGAEGEGVLAGGDAGFGAGEVGELDNEFRERELAAFEGDGEIGPERERGRGRLIAFPPALAPGLLVVTVGEMAMRGGEEPADRVRIELAGLDEMRVRFGEATEPGLLRAFQRTAEGRGDVGDQRFAGGGRGRREGVIGGRIAEAVEQREPGGVSVFALDLDGTGAVRRPAVHGVVIEADRVELGALDLGENAGAGDAKSADAALALVKFTALARRGRKRLKPRGEFVGVAGDRGVGGVRRMVGRGQGRGNRASVWQNARLACGGGAG